MSLPPAVSREAIHTRSIVCEAFRRADGMMDIEGHITDQRAFDYISHWQGHVDAATPLHEMYLRLTVDDARTIREVASTLEHTPFPGCSGVAANYQRLVGLSIGPGLSQRVKDVVGGVEGCTHVNNIIQVMATTLLQALVSEIQRYWPDSDIDQHHPAHTALLNERSLAIFPNPEAPGYPLLNSCYSHKASSPVVKHLAPQYFQPEDEDGAEAPPGSA